MARKDRTFKNGRKFTEKHFDQIKQLSDMGLKPKMIMEVSGWSHGTITKVRNSESYQQYRATRDAELARSRAKRSALESSPDEVWEGPTNTPTTFTGVLPRATTDALIVDELRTLNATLKELVQELKTRKRGWL